MVSELKKQILLADISEKDLEKLSKSIQTVSLKKDEFLFKEGGEPKGMYMIKSGMIEINKITTDGWKQTLAVLKPEHFFGEMAILEKRTHETNAVATENSEILLISKDDFNRLEKEDPSLSSQIMKKIALVTTKNLRRMNDKFLNALINY